MLKDKPTIPNSPANTPLPDVDPAHAAANRSSLSVKQRIIKELKALVQSFIEYAKKVEL
ncbi:hypothetical protein KIAC18_004410 [Sporomusa sphaeroides]|uniref:hypothetical protein n=1 Tax=Sporomusa sphaeroides TaxID=47679 RepID=UPI003DA19783